MIDLDTFVFFLDDLPEGTLKLEQRIEGQIGDELRNKCQDRYDQEKAEIEEKLIKLPEPVSNLDDSINFVIKFTLESPLKWVSADYNAKQRIEYLLFPRGLN